MKTLLTSFLMFSATAMAADCNVDLHGELSLEQDILTLYTQNDEPLVLNGRDATFNGSPMTLDTEQQQLLNQYHQSVSELAPQVAGIAIDAVGLASEGINSAFGELLGHDDELVTEFSTEMEGLKKKLSQRFYADDGSISFNSIQLKEDNFLGSQFESEIENMIEGMVQRSMGSLMMTIGKEMISSGGNMGAFEQRMERFGDRIEKTMTTKAAGIEDRAEHLCHDIVHLDVLEKQIANHIPALSELDIVRVKGKQYSLK